MRLRPRFTLWFALAALVPIAVAALVTREVVSRTYTDEFVWVGNTAAGAIQSELDRREAAVIDVVAGMDDRHPLVDGVFLELRKSGGVLPNQTRREIKKRAQEYMRGLGLDVLFLVDGRSEVLAAPHYRAAHDTVDPEPSRRAERLAERAYYTRELVIRADQIASLLVVESAQQYRDGRHRVTVVAGRAIDAALIESVRQPGRIDARIVTARGGEVLVPAAETWWGRDDHAAETIRIPLEGPEGTPVAVIEVGISRADLQQILARVTAAALVLAGAALLMTTLVGVFVARRMTRDLDQLVEGAQAASRGELDHRVKVRGRDEIGAVAHAFNLMMEELKTSKERLVMAERVAAWQEIAKRLAHEIKNPLTPIQMAVETLRKTWTKKHPSFNEIFEESTATVLEETGRLKRIVSEFSQFARMPKPALAPCDLNDVVSGCLALYGGAVTVVREFAHELPPIQADRDQLAQVVLNLLENARDALAAIPAQNAARIVVATRVSERSDQVELIIEDNGPGIDDRSKEKLFTPYFTTKQLKGGSGLGLAIVHRIVSDHNGRILARDADNGGARFVVQLPVSTADDAHDGAA